MARTGPIHGFGVFLIFVASILILITTITSPVVNRMPIFTVSLANSSNVNFGTFGWCVTNVQTGANSGNDYCTGRNIGYDAATETANAVQSGPGKFDHDTAAAANSLTNAFILHPIACGIVFLACLIGIGAGMFGSVCSFLVSVVAWAITLIAMAVDFVAFGYIKTAVNTDTSTLAVANFSVGMWTLLAAFIILFFGMLIVLFTCCSARRHRRRDYEAAPKSEPYMGAGGAAEPMMGNGGGSRRWRQFRN